MYKWKLVSKRASEAVSGECEEGRWATRPSRPPSENGGWFLTWETKKLGIVCVLLVWFLCDCYYRDGVTSLVENNFLHCDLPSEVRKIDRQLQQRLGYLDEKWRAGNHIAMKK